MRGGAACPGRVRATGGRADAGAGRAPRVARALLRTDSGGATAPQAVPGRRPKLDRRMAEARDLLAALTRLPATSTPYPGGRRDVEGARRPGQLRPAQPQPGSRRRARGQDAGGAGARRRAHRNDQWACSKWPAWAGHKAGRRGGSLGGGAGREPCSSQRPIRVTPKRRGRSLILEGRAGAVLCLLSWS